MYCVLVSFVLSMAMPALLRAEESSGYDTAPPRKAQYHWILHCQGCHGAEADGTPGRVPRLTGNVARFLHIKAGRAYLGRVPGVAFVALKDDEVAELLNWVVEHFDAQHLPRPFRPYTAEEIGVLRRDPLISDVFNERSRLLESLTRARQ